MKTQRIIATMCLTAVVLVSAGVWASSHREAPFITELPKVDGTDFYLFRSYETGRENFVTLIANHIPLQNAYGGPNYFFLDPEALYEIHLDNNGDAREDITFQFQFQNTLRSLALDIGAAGDIRTVAVPLINIGSVGPGVDDTANLNLVETYTLKIVRGDRRTGTVEDIRNAATDATSFAKPVDNIGNKSVPAYETYANDHIHNITIPGCETPGRVFVGQRREPFFINLGEVFDLVNVPNPIGEEFAANRDNILRDVNVTALALEVPISCLTAGDEPVIGGWMTSSLRQSRVLNAAPSTDPAAQGPTVEGGAWTQVSRLATPLVNEIIIGLPDKDRFNASEPISDTQFLQYVTHPTFPELLEILFGTADVRAPDVFPRNDLVTTFLTGIPAARLQPLGLEAAANQPANVIAAEMLRLNTSTPVTAFAAQNRLGVIGGDVAGFPNGRRPADDVVDIELRVAMGLLLSLGLFGEEAAGLAPSGLSEFTDGAVAESGLFGETFPYLAPPLPGSPIEAGQP